MGKVEKFKLKGLKKVIYRQDVLDWVGSCGDRNVDVHKKQAYPGFFGTFDVLNSYESEYSVPIRIEDGVYLVAGNTKLKTDIPFLYDEDGTKVYSSNEKLVFVLPQGYKGNKVIYEIVKK